MKGEVVPINKVEGLIYIYRAADDNDNSALITYSRELHEISLSDKIIIVGNAILQNLFIKDQNRK